MSIDGYGAMVAIGKLLFVGVMIAGAYWGIQALIKKGKDRY